MLFDGIANLVVVSKPVPCASGEEVVPAGIAWSCLRSVAHGCITTSLIPARAVSSHSSTLLSHCVRRNHTPSSNDPAPPKSSYGLHRPDARQTLRVSVHHDAPRTS